MSTIKRWVIGILATIGIAVIVITTSILWMLSQWSKEGQNVAPSLGWVGYLTEHGRTIVGFQNPCPKPVDITRITYVISDPDQLKYIEANPIPAPDQLKHILANAPKAAGPRSEATRKYIAAHPKASPTEIVEGMKAEGVETLERNELPYPSDEVNLGQGHWKHDRYEFYVDLGIHVPATSFQDVVPRIIQEQWAGHRFTGTLIIESRPVNRLQAKNDDIEIEGIEIICEHPDDHEEGLKEQ